jgi:hypothetical protein
MLQEIQLDGHRFSFPTANDTPGNSAESVTGGYAQ